ncbi:hypothetical protein ANN_03321, partial [Periplaneta americana]
VTLLTLNELIGEDVYIYSIALTAQQLKAVLEISINSTNSSSFNSSDFLHTSDAAETMIHFKLRAIVGHGFMQHIPNLTRPVNNNDVTLQQNRNKTAGSGDSVIQTQRSFWQHFDIGQNDKVPSRKSITRWVQQFRATASAANKKPSDRPRTVRTPDNIARVTAALERSLLQVAYYDQPVNGSRISTIKTVSETSMIFSEIDLKENSTLYNISVPLSFLKMESYKKLLGSVNASYHAVTVVEAVARYINNTEFLFLPAVGTRLMKMELPAQPPSPPPPPPPCESNTGTTIIVEWLDGQFSWVRILAGPSGICGRRKRCLVIGFHRIYDVSIICQPDRSRLVPVAWQQWSEMEALIPSPAACEVRSVIKFFNAQSIAPIEIHRQLCQEMLCFI